MAPTWRIYYTDGTTFSSLDGDPVEAPGYGVVCIAQVYEDTGRMVLRRWDWYYWSPSTRAWWGATDLHSVLDHILNRTGFVDAGSVCQGRHAPDYKAICKRAEDDPDFPVRSARTPLEVPPHS